MFKRVDRKRKRREEEEDSGLDGDTKQILDLNDTDSDESDASESTSAGDEDEDEDANEEPLISVEEALKDPIYLVSFDPTVYGCVLCKGRFIKNAGMAIAHKNANVHMRRLERFRLLSADADPRASAWQLVKKAIRSASSVQKASLHEPSKRALKRQAKHATIRERRERHKELKTRAMVKKSSKRLLAAKGASPVASPKANLRYSPESRNHSAKTRKKRNFESNRGTTMKSTLRIKTSTHSKKLMLKSRIRSTGKAS